MKINKFILSSTIAAIALSSFSIILYSCKKGADHKAFTVSGTVVNESNIPIVNAMVKSGSASAITATDGSFILAGLSSSQSVFQIQVDATGYFTQFKNLDNIDGSSLKTQIVLIQSSSLGKLNATSGGSLGATGLRVIIPPNSLTTSDGKIYTGNVTVNARYINKTNTNIAGLMPGGDFSATDASGNAGGMRTYGFVATQFTDATGNTLIANANVKVAVTLPTGVTDPTTVGGMNWAYNPNSGLWNTPTNITKTGSEYYFPCTTLYQNIDKFIQFGYINGTVTCPNGSPAAFITINIQNQNDGYVTTTNENGMFKAKVEASGNQFTVTAAGGNSLTGIQAGSTVSLTTIQCANTNSPPTSGGTGQFIFNGTSNSGACGSTPDVAGCAGLDVVISSTSSNTIIIYNIPSGSSGTYNFTDAYQNAGTCILYGIATINGSEYGTKSGTITKTGANNFTISCIVYDLLTNASYTVTGNGNY